MREEGDEDWGEPPHGDVIARLLAERYPILPGEKLTVDVAEDRRMVLALWDRRHRYTLSVKYVAGAAGRDGWLLIADALDGLFGTLMENGRRHRDLPSGAGVLFEGAVFEVVVERDLPEVTKLADRLLDRDG